MFLFELSELNTLCTQCSKRDSIFSSILAGKKHTALLLFILFLPPLKQAPFKAQPAARLHSSVTHKCEGLLGVGLLCEEKQRSAGVPRFPSPPLLSLRGERGQVLKDLQLGLRGAWFTGSEQSRISPVLLPSLKEPEHRSHAVSWGGGGGPPLVSFENKPICIGGQTPLCWWEKGRGMLPLINAELDILKTSSRSTKFNRIWSFPFRQNWIAGPCPFGSDLEKWVSSCWQLVLFGTSQCIIFSDSIKEPLRTKTKTPTTLLQHESNYLKRHPPLNQLQ